MSKPSTTTDYRLSADFSQVREDLLQDKYTDRLHKPLGYWVLPSDRRLPLAFLGRTVGNLLETPFEVLAATPGIGQKKIASLVELLRRATQDEPPTVPVGSVHDATVEPAAGARNRFDPSIVSEALWAQWRERVGRLGVGGEKLGRIAPSLQALPTVIWHTPLSQYLDYSLAEIRRLRTHGEKRVRCVLEVFYTVNARLEDGEDVSPAVLTDRLTPPLIRQVRQWIAQRLDSQELPSTDEIREQLVRPLLEQIRIDSGETVYRLAAERLGIDGPPVSVRQQSETLGVTRARIYQLLDDCHKVMSVRWPQGKQEMERLTRHFNVLGHDAERMRQFYGFRELLFPEKHRERASGEFSRAGGSTSEAEFSTN